MNMEWPQVFVLIVANFAMIIPLFLWSRSESRSDSRMMLGVIDSIQKEMKDFHGRLCILEERYLQLISRKEKTDP